MKKLLIILCGISSTICGAQQFTTKTEILLPDSLASSKPNWIDVDNDGLLDLLVSSQDRYGRTFFLIYKNDTTSGFQFKSVIESKLTNAVYHFSDTDLDNDIDVIVSGVNGTQPETAFLNNDDDFKFSRALITPIEARSIAFGDLNSDGFPEIILSGIKNNNPFFSILKNISGNWKVVHDSVKINASAIVVYDFDKDSKNDFAVSGRSEGGAIVNSVYFNQGYYFFKPYSTLSMIAGKLSLADFNADGYADLFAYGTNQAGQSSNAFIFNNGHTFKSRTDSLQVLQNASYQFADLNSNGKEDVYQFGTNNLGQLRHSVLTDARATVNIETPNAKEVAIGDYEHDGDLDLAVVLPGVVGLKVAIYTNNVPVNKGPSKLQQVISAQLYNRLFMYWQGSSDDHTPSNLITYDVAIHGNTRELMMGEFDLFKTRRLTSSFGNQGTTNYLLLRASYPSYAYTIQTIDNSFHAGGPDPSELCRGGMSVSSGPCPGVKIVNVEACRKEIITFTEPHAMWFSFEKGMLSTATDQYVYNVTSADTLFSVALSKETNCPIIKLYNIIIKEKLVRKTEQVKYVCSDAANLFSVEDGWEQVDWSSSLKGFLSHANSVQFKTSQPDTLKVKLLNGEGCVLQRNTVLKLSVPVVTVESETYQILRGESVRLKASGAASYTWTPPESLSDPTVADPVASPLHSVQYTVTGKDSIGCFGNAIVNIIVEGTAFIPNLFTPNEDGQNDDVRIYGLADVTNFSFTIHNREGSVVFETHDVHHATAIGWDGTSRGSKQPNGVYYWKVRGQQQSGKAIQLNGKTQGSIVLIR